MYKSLLFLDTEFTDFIDTALISIGIVSENAEHYFYAERNDWHLECDKASDFVHANILPLLTEKESERLSRQELSNKLYDWLSSLPESVIVIDYYLDWQLLCDAISDKVWPKNIHRTPLYLDVILQENTFHKGYYQYLNENKLPEHHSLNDANANRCGFSLCDDTLKSKLRIKSDSN